jgi:hypothetical protein
MKLASHLVANTASALTSWYNQYKGLWLEPKDTSALPTGGLQTHQGATLFERAGTSTTEGTITFWDGSQWVKLGKLNDISAPDGNLSMLDEDAATKRKITNLGTPTTDYDAANKLYVDGIASGLSWKNAVRAASFTNVTIATLNNGDSVGGVTVATNDRILLAIQDTPAQQGIYIVGATEGTTARSTDTDDGLELNGAAVFVNEGTYADKAYVQTLTLSAGAPTATNWTQFGASQSYTNGAAINLIGNAFSVNYDDISIGLDGGFLEVKDLGITTGRIADGAVTLTGGAGQKVTGTLPIDKGGTSATDGTTAIRKLVGHDGSANPVPSGGDIIRYNGATSRFVFEPLPAGGDAKLLEGSLTLDVVAPTIDASSMTNATRFDVTIWKNDSPASGYREVVYPDIKVHNASKLITVTFADVALNATPGYGYAVVGK